MGSFSRLNSSNNFTYMVKNIIVHHTGGSDLNPLQDSSNFTFEQCNTLHKNDPNINLGHPSALGYYIAYQYFIDKNGLVTQGRLDTEEGAHCRGHNSDSIGICLAGNFDATLPTKTQIDSLTKLLKDKVTQYNLTPDVIIPHRTFAQKTCYGNKLSDTWARDLIKTNKDTIKAQIISLLGQL